MHDRLLAGAAELDQKAVYDLAGTMGLNEKQFRIDVGGIARRRVDQDILLAEELGVKMTPTYILCTPDGKVVRLGSLDQLDSLIASARTGRAHN